MDFEKNPLVNDISRCQREAKRWLALVALTSAALLVAVCINMMQPSPASREIVSLLAIASAMAIICSSFGVRQCNDHCRSVQYGLSVFEAMKKDLEGTESELTSARYDVTDAQSDLYFAKKNAKALQDKLNAAKRELTQTRGWLDETDSKLYEAWGETQEARAELREVKLELRRAKEEAELAKRCYESLRRAYSEATLDLLKTKRERDNLRRELVLARKVIKRLLAGRNKLRYELTEAKIGFEWFLSLYYEAEERIRFAKQQIEHLEQQIERLETVNKLLAKFATDDV